MKLSGHQEDINFYANFSDHFYKKVYMSFRAPQAVESQLYILSR